MPALISQSGEFWPRGRASRTRSNIGDNLPGNFSGLELTWRLRLQKGGACIHTRPIDPYIIGKVCSRRVDRMFTHQLNPSVARVSAIGARARARARARRRVAHATAEAESAPRRVRPGQAAATVACRALRLHDATGRELAR
jgi:hypothetical protein